MATTIRAGSIVRLNPEGTATFPTLDGLSGELDGYGRVGLARVIFENRKTPVVLDASFLEMISPPKRSRLPLPLSRRKRESVVARRNQIIQDNRKILHRAFTLIRRDPNEKAMKNRLAHALGGSASVTDTLLESAQQIIADAQ